MKYTQKEIAGFRREKAEIEERRAELKKQIANHRESNEDVSDEKLRELQESVSEVGKRAAELDLILRQAEEPQKRGDVMNLKTQTKEINEENYRESQEYRDAFYRSLSAKSISDADAAIMNFGKREGVNGGSINSGGGYLVPTTTLNSIKSVLMEYGKLYSAVTKYTFDGDVSLPIGNVSETEKDENGIVKLKFEFTEVKIAQDATVATVEVKNILLKNSITALEDFIAKQLGKWLAIKLDMAVAYGSESFDGIIPSLKPKTYTNVDWTFLCKEIIGGLKGAYSRRGAFVMNTQTLWRRFMAITAGTAGIPLAQDTPIVHFENGTWYILDKAVIETDAMQDDDFIFGALNDNYIANESQEFVIEADPSPKFGEDKTQWRGKVYSGGSTVLPQEAFLFFVLDVDKAQKPKVSKNAGTITKGTLVELTSDTEKATIYYTLDGSEPTRKSEKYTASGKVEITKSCTLKAIATKGGMADSEVLTVAYTVSG